MAFVCFANLVQKPASALQYPDFIISPLPIRAPMSQKKHIAQYFPHTNPIATSNVIALRA